MLKKIGIKNVVFVALVGILLIGAGVFMAELDRSVSVSAGIEDIADEVDSAMPIGQLYLEVTGLKESQQVKLLMNGTPRMELDNPKETVDIPNGCVVEVDSRGIEGPITVVITGKSTGVVTECVGRSVTVEDGIANLGAFVVTGNQVQQ